MAPNLLHLPNGANITVTPVFGGFYFKSNDYALHSGSLPPGWTIIIQSQQDAEEATEQDDEYGDEPGRPIIHRYRTPTLRSDVLFISSISNPSNNDFKSPVSPSRQIAMMLWSTLWWYFHQPRPAPQVTTQHSSKTPDSGKPKEEWRIGIKREGIFKGRHLLSKLERMGLVAGEDSFVGTDPDDRAGQGWENMFVKQRAFWQIDPRIFLFTLSPTHNSPYPSNSPYHSRPSSPNRDSGLMSPRPQSEDLAGQGLWSPTTPGPFYSASHLPTYYPPLPQQYTITDGVRHPVRPKPPRQGETFYARFIPSMGQYLSFRCVSLSPKGVVYNGPIGSATPSFLPPNSALSSAAHSATMANLNVTPSDTELLHKWMNDDRVNAAWGVGGPVSTQEQFLRANLLNRHSFPVIGCWDGKPFGYFEIYWVKEDTLGRHAGGIEDWDRGIHVLVGEQEFRGPERVKVWMSALIHFCFLADSRTQRVLAEPRVDNTKIHGYFQDVGFFKEREVALPHKQSALMKVLREAWEAPFL